MWIYLNNKIEEISSDDPRIDWEYGWAPVNQIRYSTSSREWDFVFYSYISREDCAKRVNADIDKQVVALYSQIDTLTRRRVM
jgi:hypothetical protein